MLQYKLILSGVLHVIFAQLQHASIPLVAFLNGFFSPQLSPPTTLTHKANRMIKQKPKCVLKQTT